MASSWLDNYLGPPGARQGLNAQTFAVNLLPVLLCYYFTAVLALIHDTRLVRIGLLPLTIWTAYRAMTRVDLVATYHDPRYAHSNQGVMTGMALIVMRSLEWTFWTKPPRRISLPSSTAPDFKGDPNHRDFRKIAGDAFDLIWNLRGIGWDWSTIRPSSTTSPTEPKPRFILKNFLRSVGHALAVDVYQYITQVMSPSTFGSHAGGTIFDHSLPPFLRYLRSSFITFLGGLVIYHALTAEYAMMACVGVLVGQHPSQWPPLFQRPWRSTSLAELWGKRWHQGFRSSFTFVGSKPLSVVFGPIGKVFGAFLLSGLVHDMGLWGLGRGSDFWSVWGFFMMMAVGVVLEGVWRAVSGRQVNGRLGWAWTVIWTVGWANLLIDAWYRRGVAACSLIAEDLRPTKLIEGWVA